MTGMFLPTRSTAKRRHNSPMVSRRYSHLALPVTVAPGLIQTKSCACGGGCPRCQDKLSIQPKLKVGQPNEKYEQEADRVADTVMRMPAPEVLRGATLSGWVQRPRIQRMCTECEEEVQRQPLDEAAERPVVDTDALFPPEELKRDEEEEARAARQMIRAKRVGSGVPLAAPADLGAQLASSEAGGAPLHTETRRFMEPRFGTSFAHVRVHADGQAAAMCASLGAKAFTYGRGIYFGSGWYRQATKEGKQLIAHELAHVQQQDRDAGVARQIDHPFVQRACQAFPAYVSPGTYCETEAEARANITRACPPYRDDFLYRDGPPGPPPHPWRPIPGYGCAHHVAHILGITNGPRYANCRGGFSVTIAQITQGRAAHPLADAQDNDIWTSGVHAGVVTQVETAVPRVRVDQCGVGGNAQEVWFTYGNVYR